MRKIMKNHLVMLKVAVVCIMTLFIICNSCNEDISTKGIYIKNIALSSCENNSVLRNSDIGEYIKYSAIDNKTLKIEHNFFINCCCKDIDVKIDSNENNIIINITDEGGECNCVCPRTISFRIINLIINQTYKFVIFRNAQEYQTFDLLFTFPMDDEIQHE